ncbi:AAA family ATPase [Temperatibacter marinus]|uniref:AAA family ATPase n=1 Tax=Temperatibacter marinus TaxID=1456591 RepID=A0AA52EI41_9PROT|nr:AAA family ATPase [Temperatibacter marinus]WND02729.1 AAA family ATPase [Temperatibacter marinus]
MYISNISIENYKGIGQKTAIHLRQGLNVIVGENASGKTSIIDAIRLLLREDEFGYTPVSESDFHKPFEVSAQASESFVIQASFAGLTKDDKVTFLPWYDIDQHATLNLKVENKEKYGRFKRHVWGGSSKSSAFEWELFEKFNCIYLPPLRDAEAKLKEGKASRLAKLLKNIEAKALKELKDKGEIHSLEKKVQSFNHDIATSDDLPIKKMNDLIKSKLTDAVGEVFGQDTHIGFSEVGFNRIAESLRLFFFPDFISDGTNKDYYRSLNENSLGHNNLLYLATVLAELIDSGEEDERLKVLLVEEPEAHLHPQLQIRLLKYLEEISKNETSPIQVIVTSHSPVLASSASIESLIHISSGNTSSINATPIICTGIDKDIKHEIDGKEDVLIPASNLFLSRWLDTTKSTLLFAKGVILVEGIAEAFLVPQLAKSILKNYNEGKDKKDLLPDSLEKAGVSIVNMNGIYFKHFMRLFCNFGKQDKDCQNIEIRCAGITDKDPEKLKDEKDEKTIPATPIDPDHNDGKNPVLNLLTKINSSDYCRLYTGAYKTLEYDLAMEGNNLQVMAKVLQDNWHNRGTVYKEIKSIAEKEWNDEKPQIKGSNANIILKRIEDNNMGKGYYAQLLSEVLQEDSNFTIPDNINKAVIWACGGSVDD